MECRETAGKAGLSVRRARSAGMMFFPCDDRPIVRKNRDEIKSGERKKTGKRGRSGKNAGMKKSPDVCPGMVMSLSAGESDDGRCDPSGLLLSFFIGEGDHDIVPVADCVIDRMGFIDGVDNRSVGQGCNLVLVFLFFRRVFVPSPVDTKKRETWQQDFRFLSRFFSCAGIRQTVHRLWAGGA